MAKLQIIILSLLPLCFGQFSIQGPSDGNRRAQGLKYSSDKGIEYTDQAASLGNDGFSIQGASDGNSDFQIQGATDGNSEFRIQGATDGNSEFQIHGPTDGGSQAYIHNYDETQNQPQQAVHQGRAIEYKDPNGQRVNWRSYNRAADKAQGQYEEPAPRPAQRRPSHRRTQAAARPQPQPQQQQPEPRYQHAPVANINYNPIEKAPPSIQEILQFQAQIPYVNIIPEHLRFDALSAAQEQAKKFAEEYPKQVLAQQPPQLVIEEAPRSQYRSKPRQREQTRERRQAPEYDYGYQQQQQQQEPQAYTQEEAYTRQAYAQQQQRRQAPQYNDAYQQVQQRQAYLQQEQEQQQQYPSPVHKAYRRVVQPPTEQQPTYSANVPQQIQEILRYQAQIPYDIIANQIHYKPDKPYVPQPVQHQPQQQPAEAQPIPAQYKPQAPAYPQQYNQGPAPAYAQEQQQQGPPQGLGHYANQQYRSQPAVTPRPVNEPQY